MRPEYPRPIQVVLADDDVDDRALFSQALTEAKIPSKLVTVENGVKLTDYLANIQDPPPPDIIFLDINMPLKNGKICLKEIRSNKKFNNVPIVMFSTSSHPLDIEETYLHGANKYISKSVFFEDEVTVFKTIFSPGWQRSLHAPAKENFVLQAEDLL